MEREPRLTIPSVFWERLLWELRRRTEERHESGAFLLGHPGEEGRRVTDVVFYDDLDPNAYRTGIVVMHASSFGALWDRCRSSGLSVVADIHVHPRAAFQSRADRKKPDDRDRWAPGPCRPESCAPTGRVGEARFLRVSRQPSLAITWRIEDLAFSADRGTRRSGMIDTDHTTIADCLNRLVKLAIDTGEAESLEEAEKLFMGYRLGVSVGDDVGQSPTHQAALLTIVNSARRCLLGGIEVEGIAGMNLLVPVPLYRSLEEAVAGVGGRVVRSVRPDVPLVVVGNAKAKNQHQFAIRVTFEGWSAGILPLAHDNTRLGESYEFTPAGVLAGALAVTEAFQFLRGNQPIAGRREVGLSLWRPEMPWQRRRRLGSGHRKTTVRALADRTREPRSGIPLDLGYAALRGTRGCAAHPPGRRFSCSLERQHFVADENLN